MKLFRLLLFFFGGIFFLLSFLLFREYMHLKNHARRLIQLKESYKKYAQRYKSIAQEYKLLVKHVFLKEDISSLLPHRSSLDPQFFASSMERPFSLVNRDFAYLKDHALSYAKEHNLEKLMEPIYTGYGIFPLENAFLQPRKVNLRKPYADFFCKWPINRNAFWISSQFGPRRKANGRPGFHYGIDLAALKGTPVKAVSAGKVIEAAFSQKGYGKCIVIQHDKRIKTRYAHLDSIRVKKGDSVSLGQIIGTVGATGFVRGKTGRNNATHLHLEVMIYGKHINPLQVLA